MRQGLRTKVEATSRLAPWHFTFLCSELANFPLHSFGNSLWLFTNVFDRDWLNTRHCHPEGGGLLRARPAAARASPGPQRVLLIGMFRGTGVKKPWSSVSKLEKRFHTKSRNKAEFPERPRPQIIRSIIIRQDYAITQHGWLQAAPRPRPPSLPQPAGSLRQRQN